MQFKAAMIIAYVVLLSRALTCFAAPPATDAEKKQLIEAMIARFEGRFKVPQVDAAAAMFMAKEEGAVLLDVREAREMAVSKIPGALTQIEFEQSPSQYKNRKIIAYCTIGYRSAAYVARWNKRGYDMHNLRGSLLLWAHAQGALVDANGVPTRQVHVYGRDWDLLPDGYQSRF